MKIFLTSPDKVVFEKPRVTKQDVANYYRAVGDRMLQHIRGRKLSLVRCPSGIGGECHYRKNGVAVVETVDDIIAQVQMNTIEFHMYGAPEIMVFDLDPGDNVTLAKLRRGVRDLQSILVGIGFDSSLKTTGGKGYHVMVEIDGMSLDEFSNFARKVAELMEAKWPNRYTTNIRKNAREGKIFIDWLRNTSGATFVAPYSLRARPGATVSMPIAWDDLDRIKPDGINLNEFI